MGLPVWREPTTGDSQLKTDPTAHDRSAIRRQRRLRTNLRNPARLRREDTTGAQGSGISEHPAGFDFNTVLHQIQDDAHNGTARASGPRSGSMRPRSRRGPTSGGRDLMPPLRRMGRRQVADEMTQETEPIRRSGQIQRSEQTPPLFGTTLPDPTSIARVNGLGDRRRSWSTADDADAWNVMGSTITPDPSLPSASNSFAAEVGTSFASSNRENNRSRRTRVERPAIPRGGAVPEPPEANPAGDRAFLSSLDEADRQVHLRSRQQQGEWRRGDPRSHPVWVGPATGNTNNEALEETPAEAFDAQTGHPIPDYEAQLQETRMTDAEINRLRDHQTQLLLLEQQNRRRLLRMRQELREQGQADPEAGGSRQPENPDYCPHDGTREEEDDNGPATGETQDDSSSTTTSSDSMDEYDEADMAAFLNSTSDNEPHVAYQINMDLMRECDGFIEGLRRLMDNHHRSTDDVRNIREGLQQLRRLVDIAAERANRFSDAAAASTNQANSAAA